MKHVAIASLVGIFEGRKQHSSIFLMKEFVLQCFVYIVRCMCRAAAGIGRLSWTKLFSWIQSDEAKQRAGFYQCSVQQLNRGSHFPISPCVTCIECLTGIYILTLPTLTTITILTSLPFLTYLYHHYITNLPYHHYHPYFNLPSLPTLTTTTILTTITIHLFPHLLLVILHLPALPH